MTANEVREELKKQFRSVTKNVQLELEPTRKVEFNVFHKDTLALRNQVGIARAITQNYTKRKGAYVYISPEKLIDILFDHYISNKPLKN